jgi:hypothetical protein
MIIVPGQPGKKVMKTTNKLGVMTYIFNPSYIGDH